MPQYFYNIACIMVILHNALVSKIDLTNSLCIIKTLKTKQ